MKHIFFRRTSFLVTVFLLVLSSIFVFTPVASAASPLMTGEEARKAAQKYLAAFEMARCSLHFKDVSVDNRNDLGMYIDSKYDYMQNDDMATAWFGASESKCNALMDKFYSILGEEYSGVEDSQWSFMKGLGYTLNDNKTKAIKPKGDSIKSNIENKYKTGAYSITFSRTAENITSFDLQPESKYWLVNNYIAQICGAPSPTKPTSDILFVGEMRTINSDGTLGFNYVGCESRADYDKIEPWLRVLPQITTAYAAKYNENLLGAKARKFAEALCAESSAFGGANGSGDRAECIRAYEADYRACAQPNDYGIIDQEYVISCLEKRIDRDVREITQAVNSANEASIETSTNIPEFTHYDPETPEGGTTACSAAIGGLGWIICPVVNLLSGLTDGLFGILSNFLETDSRLLGGEVEDSWAIFRNIANILLVVGFLIIIYSQLTSFGISNYGIKRMLPRLIIVAIAINLSLFLSRAMVDLSNVLGASLYDMLGGMLDTKNWSPGVGQITSMVLGGAATVVVAGVAANLIVVAGVGVLLAALLPAVAGLFVTVFILFARNAIIVILAVISPIAVAAILLPNTESLFKKWWKVFFGLLLVYPMIAVVFGASKIAANVLVGIGDWKMQIAAAAAATVPLLFTPKLLQSSLNATGSFGAKLGGIAGSLTKGATGGLRSGIKKGAVESSVGQGITSALNYRKQKRNIRWAKNRAKAGGPIGSLYNNLGGDGYGQKRATQGVSLEDKELEEEAAEQLTLMKSNLGPAGVLGTKNSAGVYEGGAGAELADALEKNDQARVKAATQLLLNSGGIGRSIIRQQVKSFQTERPEYSSRSGYQAMQQTLNSAGLKGSDNVLARVGYSNDSVESITADKETYAKLDDFEMAGQSDKDFEAAIRSGAISRKRAIDMRNNTNLKLTDAKRDILNNQDLFNEAAANLSAATTPANPPAQPAAPQAPSPPTQPPSTP